MSVPPDICNLAEWTLIIHMVLAPPFWTSSSRVDVQYAMLYWIHRKHFFVRIAGAICLTLIPGFCERIPWPTDSMLRFRKDWMRSGAWICNQRKGSLMQMQQQKILMPVTGSKLSVQRDTPTQQHYSSTGQIQSTAGLPDA